MPVQPTDHVLTMDAATGDPDHQEMDDLMVRCAGCEFNGRARLILYSKVSPDSAAPAIQTAPLHTTGLTTDDALHVIWSHFNPYAATADLMRQAGLLLALGGLRAGIAAVIEVRHTTLVDRGAGK